MDQNAQPETETSSAPSHRRGNATFLAVLPRRLVKYRELRKVTKTALAKAAGISRTTLNAIESGQLRDIKVTTLERLCHALGVSADALLGYNSVRLVRKPQLRAVDRNPPENAPAHSCATCRKHIGVRELHLPGDCMMELSNAGETDRRIGIVFGLSTPAIALVLREEHEARRRRVF